MIKYEDIKGLERLLRKYRTVTLIPYCDGAVVSGFQAKVWDSVSGRFCEDVYLDSSGEETDTAPTGAPCP